MAILQNRADAGLAFLLRYENVAWYDAGAVRILDRRVYPMRVEFVTCRSHVEVAQAIADMVTQSGGPYTAAAMGMALAAFESRELPRVQREAYMQSAAHTLAHARPTTAPKMRQITERSLVTALGALDEGADPAQAVFEQAVCDLEHKYRRYEITGRHLATLFPQGGIVMTQCYAETIIGMMLRACRQSGKDVHFICPETRPYYQGARLTASVIRDMGFDVTVITDNMPAWAMKEKNVSVFTSAADTICMDGHIVNKVGTLQIALAAHHFGIPYFVTGTPLRECTSHKDVVIEQRDSVLVLESLGTRTVMDGVKGFYPAFDITPPTLCSGVVTDRGVFSPFDLEAYFSSGGGWVAP